MYLARVALFSLLLTAAHGSAVKAQPVDLCCGVNVLAYDTYWKVPETTHFRLGHFNAIRKVGFRTVRIGLRPDEFMDANYALNTRWVYLAKTAVDFALAADLNVIIDAHDFYKCISGTVDECTLALKAYWAQMAAVFANYSNRLVFEVINEPTGTMTPELVNSLTPQIVSQIRTTHPTRTIIVEPFQGWDLDNLVLPDGDDNLIVSFHYYRPGRFTLQGAPHSSAYKNYHDVHWGSEAEYRIVDTDFAKFAAWGKARNRRMFLGEFGTFEVAPMEDRKKWTGHVAATAKKYGMDWNLFQFGWGMTVFDFNTNSWTNEILDALFPPGNRIDRNKLIELLDALYPQDRVIPPDQKIFPCPECTAQTP